jgi:hypothetical protein
LSIDGAGHEGIGTRGGIVSAGTASVCGACSACSCASTESAWFVKVFICDCRLPITWVTADTAAAGPEPWAGLDGPV